MGQTTSASSSLKGDFAVIQNKITTLNKVAFLTYEELLKSIQELNSVTRGFTDKAGKQLCFSIKKGTDTTLLWKTTIRIRCLKINTSNNNIESTRLLKLHQYVAMHKEILERIQFLSTSPDIVEATKTEEGMNPVPSTSEGHEFLASAYFSKGDKVDSNVLREDLNECCVCMDEKACIMLSCSHEFCETCIDNWIRDKEHSNCPLCRSNVRGADDTWVLTDKYDSSDYETEVKGYLVGLADRQT